MKLSRTAAVIIAMAACAITALGKPKESAVPRWNVRVDVQMVSIPVAKALTMVPALLDEQTAEGTLAELDGMIAREQAGLLGWPVVWVQDGGREVAESIEEVRYPAEFNPPTEPGGFGARVAPVPALSAWGAEVPTSFETRNTGPTLEVEPRVEAGGKRLVLAISSQFVRLLRYQEFAKPKSPLGIEGVMEQPEFVTTKTTTTIAVRNGRRTLCGVFVVAEPEPRVELFIVRAAAFPNDFKRSSHP